MIATKKNKNGCLWLFLFGIMSLFGWFLLAGLGGFNTYLSLVVAMLISGVLTSKWLGRPALKSILIYAGVLLFLLFGLKTIINFLVKGITIASEDHTFKVEEGVRLSTLVEANDTIDVYTSDRDWRDNYGNAYRAALTVRKEDYLRLKNNLNTWTAKEDGGHFWGSLYDYLEQTDGPSLDLVMKAFQQIHRSRKLDQMEFAEMVVSCVQDIPYSFIFQEECLNAERYEQSIRSILEDCPECCLGNIPFGIQNPISFLQNLKGDCDTRTVMIYAVLKHFNYDVAILNSEFYRHSIIGINLPAPGLHKRHYGKKYVVWETTAKYYEAGKLPGNFNDITHWNVILTSK